MEGGRGTPSAGTELRLIVFSLLADDGLAVVAGDVVEPHPVVIEVVEHAHAELVTLPVVRLAATSTTNNYSYYS